MKLWAVLVFFVGDCASEKISGWTSPTSNAFGDLRFLESTTRTMELCEGGSKNIAFIQVDIKSGVPPWKLEVLRNGNVYEKIEIKQEHRRTTLGSEVSGSHILNTTVPGEFSLGQLWDSNSCRGNVSFAKLSVNIHPIPMANFEPTNSSICHQSDYPKLFLSGSPPFKVVFSAMELSDGDISKRSFSVTFYSPGSQKLPQFPFAGMHFDCSVIQGHPSLNSFRPSQVCGQ